MKNYLYNELVSLLVGLQELELTDARTSIVETLDLLAGEVTTSLAVIKTQAHTLLDQGDMVGVEKCMKLVNSLSGLSQTITTLQDAEICTNTQHDTEEPLVLDASGKNTKPIAFWIKGKKYHLARYTWRQLFYQVLCVLAELDSSRFEELVRILNNRKLTYYQFSCDSDSLLSNTYKNKPWHIPSVNMYVKLTGDASVMRRSTYEAINFFNFTTAFDIETNNSDANNIINIVDDDEE